MTRAFLDETGTTQAPSGIIDAIVFSKDRPLQLDGLLRSLRLHCSDLQRLRVRILYCASNSYIRNLYEVLKSEHPDVTFVPEKDFRTDLQRLATGSRFLLFLVDDTLFVGALRVDEIIRSLDGEPQAVGFSLRLGRNTTYCYTLDRRQAMPASSEVVSGQVLSFPWTVGEADFGYPLELSSSVYRTADVVGLLRSQHYLNPNTLEAALARSAGQFSSARPHLLSFARSVAFSAPLNMVQTVFDNRVAGVPTASIEALARAFHDGHRIDVDALTTIVPNAAHQEIDLPLAHIAQPRPKVSVVIPCYMQEGYLRQAVKSVISQTFTDWELLIVNDGSPDETSRVARQCIREHPDCSIRLIEAPNGGPSAARNRGIAASRGWLILPLDADDVLHPTMLERTVGALDSDWAAAIAYGGYAEFGAGDDVLQPNTYNFERLCFRNQMPYCSLFRRHAWVDTGGYKPEMRWGYEDWEFWVSCGEAGAAGTSVGGGLFFYRVSPVSRSTSAAEHDTELRRRLRALHPHLYSLRKRLLRLVRIAPPVLAGRIGSSAMAGRAVVSRVPALRRNHHSVNDLDRYREVCRLAALDDRAFETFRSEPSYRLAFEDVTEQQGAHYLQIIRRDSPHLLSDFDRLHASDRLGSPRLFAYPGIGPVSPATLRDFKVLSDLMRLFGDLDGFQIAEIGVGYGGLARVICDQFRPASYTLVDSDEPLQLARRFLSHFDASGLAYWHDAEPERARSFDLVISSSRVFTEFPRTMQDHFVGSVVRKSASGYMRATVIDTKPRSQSYSVRELFELKPDIVLHADGPLAKPENVILTWGERVR